MAAFVFVARGGESGNRGRRDETGCYVSRYLDLAAARFGFRPVLVPNRMAGQFHGLGTTWASERNARIIGSDFAVRTIRRNLPGSGNGRFATDRATGSAGS